jgi:hypothetical protein
MGFEARTEGVRSRRGPTGFKASGDVVGGTTAVTSDPPSEGRRWTGFKVGGLFFDHSRRRGPTGFEARTEGVRSRRGPTGFKARGDVVRATTAVMSDAPSEGRRWTGFEAWGLFFDHSRERTATGFKARRDGVRGTGGPMGFKARGDVVGTTSAGMLDPSSEGRQWTGFEARGLFFNRFRRPPRSLFRRFRFSTAAR